MKVDFLKINAIIIKDCTGTIVDRIDIASVDFKPKEKYLIITEKE